MRTVGATATIVIAAILIAVAAGCGASSDARHGGGEMGDQSRMSTGGAGMMNGRGGMTAGSPTTSPAAPGTPGSGAAAQGRALFLSSGCGGCHTLADAGTTGTAGPDLDDAHPAYALIVQRVRDGTGAMPSFVGSLTDAQIRAIARYVADATR